MLSSLGPMFALAVSIINFKRTVYVCNVVGSCCFDVVVEISICHLACAADLLLMLRTIAYPQLLLLQE